MDERETDEESVQTGELQVIKTEFKITRKSGLCVSL